MKNHLLREPLRDRLTHMADRAVDGTTPRRNRSRAAAIMTAALLAIGVPAAAYATAAPKPSPETQVSEGTADALLAPTCTPIASPDEAEAHRSQLQSLFSLYFQLSNLPVAGRLYTAYVTPGKASANRTELTDAAVLRAFRTDALTRQAQTDLLQSVAGQVTAEPPALRAADNPVAVTPSSAVLERVQSQLEWDDLATYPGILAGGRSGTEFGGLKFNDERNITGTYQLVPAATGKGVLTSVTLRASGMRLGVTDSIDFCPGNTLEEGHFLHEYLVAASNLEKTKHPNAGAADPNDATFSKPILFGLTTDLDNPSQVDITQAFKGNDVDGDSVPEAQPWVGAAFMLDNCPTVENPDQADTDSNGVGDACEA